MACRDFERRVALYVEEDLDAVERYATERHLRLCKDCAVLAQDLRESQALFKSLRQNVPDEAMLSSVRHEVLREVQTTSRDWAGIFFAVFRARATLAGVIMLLVGSSIWFYEGREEVNPIPVAPSPVAPPVVVPRDPLPLSVPKVAAAVREKRRPVKPVVPVNAPDLKGQPLTIKFLTDDPNVIIYWLVDGNGD